MEGHGVLIAPQWVVTAAHAVAWQSRVDVIVLNGEPRAIEKIIFHSGFQKMPQTLIDAAMESKDATAAMAFLAASDDIALLKLAAPVVDVVPAKIYRGVSLGKVVQILGKGATGTGAKGHHPHGPNRTDLRHAFNVISNSDGRWLSYIFDRPPAALPLEGIAGNGDSGGPLLIADGDQWHVAGLTSWKHVDGDPATEWPGKYGQINYAVRLGHYAEWIEATMALDREAEENGSVQLPIDSSPSVISTISSAAQERPEWGEFFGEFKAQGTLVVVDERANSQSVLVYGPERARKRFPPASTFKIPHTLFALDAGAVHDEFQVFEWDGKVERDFSGHNRDQDLRSAMRASAMWLYEQFAREIGEAGARSYLGRIDYGNADPTTDEGAYWVDGNLAISAHEQILFLKRLYRNELPFKIQHQRLVKDVMIVEAGRNWILRAKTGWEGRMGWWVGWVEWPTGPVFFALNIDTPNRTGDLAKREQITRAILQSIDALPTP
jgi:beta-lactamase class D